ncbi:uncharacterized protein LOC115888213 [Sitophilus oryzae]|uniref:Uncharacterized protein LOC115888213 n=1 Tax=Sitophilus oryzae TaxID=7048 RepID=A0A6J2YK91_SITOR|nr:uncharacterized protein LOC115888213 [Sitophilus oryzae]
MDEQKKLKQELLEILTEVAKVKKIKDFELIPNVNLNYGDGFVSHFYTGQVKNRENDETFEVAIKKCPANRSEIMGSLFNNEIIFYESIFPMMRDFQLKRNIVEVVDNVPGYICGSTEPNKAYVAMDNVKHLRYVLYDKTKFFNEEHLTSIFKLYGKFHALSFALEKSEPVAAKDIQKGLFNTFSNIPDQVLHQLKEPFEIAVANLESEDRQNIFEKVSYVLDNMKEVYSKCCSYSGKYSCIIHGDCWSNNMLFKYNVSTFVM